MSIYLGTIEYYIIILKIFFNFISSCSCLTPQNIFLIFATEEIVTFEGLGIFRLFFVFFLILGSREKTQEKRKNQKAVFI